MTGFKKQDKNVFIFKNQLYRMLRNTPTQIATNTLAQNRQSKSIVGKMILLVMNSETLCCHWKYIFTHKLFRPLYVERSEFVQQAFFHVLLYNTELYTTKQHGT